MSRTSPATGAPDVLRPGTFEDVPDERLEAELRAAGLLVSGSGGVGDHGPDDIGGGGGGEGGDDEPEWPRRHHPPAVRVFAVVTAAFLILGTAGAWVSLAIEGAREDFPATAVVVGSAPAGGAPTAAHPGHSAARTWQVAVDVTNRSGASARPLCDVLVDADGYVGVATVALDRMGPGATGSRTVSVRVDGAPATKDTAALVACGTR